MYSVTVVPLLLHYILVWLGILFLQL